MSRIGALIEHALSLAADQLADWRVALHMRLHHPEGQTCEDAEPVILPPVEVQPAPTPPVITVIDYCLNCGLSRIAGTLNHCPRCGVTQLENMPAECRREGAS